VTAAPHTPHHAQSGSTLHALRRRSPSISEPPVHRGQVKRKVFPRITNRAIEVDGPVAEEKQRVWLRGYNLLQQSRRIASDHRVVTFARPDKDRWSRTCIDTAWFPHKGYYHLCLGLSHIGQNGNATYQTANTPQGGPTVIANSSHSVRVTTMATGVSGCAVKSAK